MHVMGIKKQWRKSKVNQEQWQGLEVMAEEEDLRWLQDCFVGTVKSPETISTLQDKFLMEGYFFAKVTPMGGRLVLLSSVDHEELKDLVDNGKDWLAQWFSDVRPWKPTEVAFERFTWLRCQGVPVHIWRSSFFETVAHLFEKFISLDDSTIKKKRLDLAKILILTPVQENIQRVLRVKVGRIIFQIHVNEEIGVDNLFSLRSDFILISDGVSTSEKWSDESSGDFNEDDKWDGNWQLSEEDEEVQQLPEMAEIAPVESERSLNLSMEEVKISEKICVHEGSLNAACQNSNSLAADEELEVNDSGAALENTLKSSEDKRSGSRHLNNGDPNPYCHPNSSQGPSQKTFALGQSSLIQVGAKPKGDDKGDNEKAELIDKKRNKKVESATQSKYAVKLSKGVSPSRNLGEEKGIPDESPRSQEEEDRQTQPFWEGLASEDEILQSRAERLARDKKRKKQMERRMRKWIEVRWQKRKESKKQILSKDADNRRGDAPIVQTEPPTQRPELKNSCWREVEEIWSLGKQLGLVDKKNAEEIILRLKEMEERDRAALATQKATAKGMGDSKKRRGLRDLIRREGADIVFIQESKMEVCDDRKCKYVWGGDNCRWVMKAAHGKSGGILCLWNSNLFELSKDLVGSGFCGMYGFWGVDKLPCYFLNVYAPCDSLGKQLLWKEILDLTEVSDGGNWCIGGDFNAIRSREEKRGRHFNNTAMRDFNSFIDEAGLEDLPMTGKKFTWFKTDGSAMSRLDRFLVSTGFLINFPDLIQKEWNREVFGHIDRNLEKIRCEIKNLDDKAENGELSETEIEQRRSYFQQVWEWNSRKDSLLCQKSRQKWLQEGDANSKYFHGCIVKRRRRNGIEGVVKNEAWVEEVPEVKKVIKEFFELKFQEQEWDRPSLELNQLKQLSPEDNSWLTAEFSKEEVKAAVWNCNGSKSPGPDGFNFNFIKKMWPTIKQDIVDFVKKFWANGRLVKGSNSSFIVLIPKKESPQGLGDYRPISLVGCLYKIISKLLANRLRKVMPTIISQNQSAFVGKRFIADGIVIANEIIHEAKKRRRPTLIFKADFEKAYDSVNWKFLELMMEKFGFCLKWRKWIKECLSTSSVSVLVNGSPTAEFSMEKGLRQGDPLAPFLFLLVAEALNELIYKAKELNLYKGVEMGEERLEVTHLQFADDSIFFCDASDLNIKAIKGILRTFELVSGLKVNFFKSALYGINVKAEDISKWAESLNCMVGDIPFKYLGVPVGANPRKFSTWAPIIDCLRLKLSGWKCESLSFGGRIVLLNVVLSSIPVYFFAIMRAPIKDLEKLLKECKLMKGKQDFWSWKHDSKGNYSTKSAYSLLNNSIEEPGSIQFNKI
ncbi:hypothetical protein SLEP1_g17145 [Rubroshorea leprosula]|uniref:Reverse transcriptase domain-containing protein n=1 Tax=Rubroshorea leprosula TaxID=152421 RepID=A0AAV5J2F1_9ROSI|nr:hypothetical protein SLEP1_g17145 [Rubroshorea leprosula]